MNSKGSTLIEMLVVIGIIVLIAAFAMPNISSYFQLSLNSAARDLSTVIQEAYNSTMVTGRIHRLVYDLKEQNYWVESGPPQTLLDTAETKEKEEKKRKYSRDSNTPPPSVFKMETSVSRKKLILPRGVEYEDIVNQQGPEPITTGIAYTHFFPDGIAEQTVIHLKDQSKHHVSLVVTPLLGKMELYDRYVQAKEAYGE